MTLQTTWTNMRAPPSSSPSPSPSLAVSPPHPSDNKITAWLREAPLTLLLRQLNNDFAPAWRVCQRGDPASALPRQGFHCNNSFHHGWRATASSFVKLQSIFTEACLCERDRERMEWVKVINVVGSMCVCVCVHKEVQEGNTAYQHPPTFRTKWSKSSFEFMPSSLSCMHGRRAAGMCLIPLLCTCLTLLRCDINGKRQPHRIGRMKRATRRREKKKKGQLDCVWSSLWDEEEEGGQREEDKKRTKHHD